MTIVLGLDIGGTKLLVEAAGLAGETLARAQARTPSGLVDGLALIDRLISEASQGRPLDAIGVAIGGPLDHDTGIVSPLHQPEWRSVPLGRILKDRYECPVALDVDTNVAALGEYRFGGAQVSRLLYVTMSTGLGGGFLIDGAVYRGAGGVHTEKGHQAIPFRCAHPERVSCECGAPDCLEAVVSGNAIRRIYGKPAEDLEPAEWREVGYNLGQGLRNAAAIYLPDLIVLGGGVAIGGGGPLIAAVRAVLEDRLRIVPVPAVRTSALGAQTAARGAIALALAQIQRDADAGLPPGNP